MPCRTHKHTQTKPKQTQNTPEPRAPQIVPSVFPVCQRRRARGIALCLASFHGESATSPLSICQFMDVAVMSASPYTGCAVHCVNKRANRHGRHRRQEHNTDTRGNTPRPSERPPSPPTTSQELRKKRFLINRRWEGVRS